MRTPTIPTFEPSEITRGATVAWTRSLVDYPPADGWTLTYYFRGKGGVGVDVVATVDGSAYSNVMTAAQSQTLAAGRYDWQAWVEKGTGPTLERHLVGSGIVAVKLGFTDIDTDTNVDGRTDNEKALEVVRAVLSKKATADQMSYTIGNRSVQRYTLTELNTIEKRLVQLVNAERRAARIRRGEPFFQNVAARFK